MSNIHIVPMLIGAMLGITFAIWAELALESVFHWDVTSNIERVFVIAPPIILLTTGILLVIFG